MVLVGVLGSMCLMIRGVLMGLICCGFERYWVARTYEGTIPAAGKSDGVRNLPMW